MLLRILKELGRGEQAGQELYDSMILSVDVAHGVHPNQAGKMDITNKPVLGKGFCRKEAAPPPVPTVDIGIPLLAMHSARELMGTSDQKALKDLAEAYFSL